MAELDDLPAIDQADVSNDDFLLIFDNSASTSKSRKVTRGHLLNGVAFTGGDHDFGTSEITALTATEATVVDLTVTTSLVFDSAATLQKMYRLSGNVVVGTLAGGAGETKTATVTGVATGDYVSISFTAALPDGLMAQAWVSGGNTVSIRFYNATAGSIAGATVTARIVVMRFA